MKCQILFFGKNNKNIILLSSAESAHRVVKVKTCLNPSELFVKHPVHLASSPPFKLGLHSEVFALMDLLF